MRRGFTLMEAIVAMVVLALLVPMSVAALADASRSRAEAAAITRATWLANAVLEHVIADVNSPAPALGMEALEDPAAYLDSPGAGLRARMAPIDGLYAGLGFAWDLQIGPLVGADGAATGDPELDVYRYVQAQVGWNSAGHGAMSMSAGVLVTDLNP